MIPLTQTITAGRADGHSVDGLPGNCLQAAVASMLDLQLDQVPHFAVYADWFGAMRRWARERDGDFTYFEFPVLEQYQVGWDSVLAWGRQNNGHILLSGPSPRGPFWHVVCGDVDLHLVHDPHPSGDGLLEVRDAIVYCSPYDPPPITRELTTSTKGTR